MLSIKENIFSYNLRLLKLTGIVILIILSTFPYFNLILSQQIILLLLLAVFVSMLKLSFRFLFGIALVFIIFSMIVSLFSLNATAEKLGNYAYMSFVIGFVGSNIKYARFKNEIN